MGKTIDELRAQLDERPLLPGEGVDTQAEGDVRATAWYSFIKDIEDLVESDDYTWALTTLLGIRETVERTKRVSEAQQRAVVNIASARRAPHPRGASRRYEGFSRR